MADEGGDFEWAAPDSEVHAFINHLELPVGTYLYGRRMYETMAVWETMDPAGQSRETQDFAAIWRAAEKIVYSSSLAEVSTQRTRLEPSFQVTTVRALKASSTRDLTIGGPTLAAEALRASLVDEFQLFVVPVVIGGGTHWLPRGWRVRLELLDERRFRGGMVYLRYAVASS